MNYTMDLIRNSKSKSVQNVLSATKALHEGLQLLKDRGGTDSHIDKVKQAASESLALDLFERNRAEAARLTSEIEKQKAIYITNYERNESTNSKNVDNARRRTMAMSKDEMLDEVNAIMGRAFEPTDPAILDEISISLKDTDPESFQTFRDWLKRNNYSEPWKHLPETKEIAKDLNFLNNNPSDLMLKTEKGERFSLSIRELNDFVSVDSDIAKEEAGL